MAPTAVLLASRGHPSAVLGYCQEDGLPASMRAIPVEVLTEAIGAFATMETVDPARIAVWAASVGTGLALAALAGPDRPHVCRVIAVSPTDVVWQALAEHGPPPKASSLARSGVELAYLPMHGERLLGQLVRHALTRRLPGRARSSAMRLYPAYTRGKESPAVIAAASIPVEDIAAPMLLIAGTEDEMWPSATMAQTIARRRREHGVGTDDHLLLLPDAGHFMRPPGTPSTADRSADLVSGGTQDGIARGKRQAWQAALAFLDHPG